MKDSEMTVEAIRKSIQKDIQNWQADLTFWIDHQEQANRMVNIFKNKIAMAEKDLNDLKKFSS